VGGVGGSLFFFFFSLGLFGFFFFVGGGGGGGGGGTAIRLYGSHPQDELNRAFFNLRGPPSSLISQARVKLEFAAPKVVGPTTLTLYFMCDSYMGCDQEFELELNIKEGDEEGAEPMEGWLNDVAVGGTDAAGPDWLDWTS
jgi:hypothetical protein